MLIIFFNICNISGKKQLLSKIAFFLKKWREIKYFGLNLQKNFRRKMRKILLLALVCMTASTLSKAQVSEIPTDRTQSDIFGAYKFVLSRSAACYRENGEHMDKQLFPSYSEYSIFWDLENGNFIFPEDSLPPAYSNVVRTKQNSYTVSTPHLALHYRNHKDNIVIFSSKTRIGGQSITWEESLFTNVMNGYLLGDNMYQLKNEDELAAGISATTKLLVIPSMSKSSGDDTYFANELASKYPELAESLEKFVKRGGTIYAEGTGGYLLQALGLFSNGTFDYVGGADVDGYVSVVANDNHFLSHVVSATSDSLYAVRFPRVDAAKVSPVVATHGGLPVVFEKTLGHGKIVVNTGLPMMGGQLASKESNPALKANIRQWQWLMAMIAYANSTPVDVSRTVRNDIAVGVTAPDNAIPYDVVDTFNVSVRVRNLSGSAQTINVKETVAKYFSVVQGGDFAWDGTGKVLTKNITLAPYEVKDLGYKLTTPKPESEVHEKMGEEVGSDNLVSVSNSFVTWDDMPEYAMIERYRARAYIMFGADLYCDVDMNYKNPGGPYYQSFKVFMNVENKGRTSATDVVYTHYIPIDVPMYVSEAGNINIPILKSAGGKYIDILRGWAGLDDKNIPADSLQWCDMDCDGEPDAWIDMSSIYPTPTTWKDTLIYWKTPWEHFRGEPWVHNSNVNLYREIHPDSVYWYEDINHNGHYTCYKEGRGWYGVKNGIEVSDPDPGDLIRSRKVVWNYGEIPGLQTYEPLWSYEIWFDVPNLPEMAAGVSKAYGKLGKSFSTEEYFPYHGKGDDIKDIAQIRAECPKCDSLWQNWMYKDASGKPVWKNFLNVQRFEYLGYKWVDTTHVLDTAIYSGTKKPFEELLGLSPVPRDEMNIVGALGGEEIDMEKFKPIRREYSRVDYKTIFNEEKVEPTRTPYTFYVPLPNPMQFEYLSNSYKITDPVTGSPLKYLPRKGKVNITYDLAAATEYSYYWIRHVGTAVGTDMRAGTNKHVHKIKYTPNENTWKYDYSKYIDGIDSIGDGVIGYLVYEIPKGMGGYKMTLPTKADGSYDISKIVQVKTPRALDKSSAPNQEDGKRRFKQMMESMEYQPWEPIHHNENTSDSIKIFDDGLKYSIWIPQLLIPASLSDKNNDGIDDWIDDEGDRFFHANNHSYIEDAVPQGRGYDVEWQNCPGHDDGNMGYSLQGWCHGSDGEWGSDEFQELGKTYFRINAIYEGKGKEGPVSISRGGTLVCEEIFGGSPWVVYSHTMAGWAEGVELEMNSKVVPNVVRFGEDTAVVVHTITDTDEPHQFNDIFDPYHVTMCSDIATVTTYVGGKDPCSLIFPAHAVNTSSNIDVKRNMSAVLMPDAVDNEELEALGYPKNVSGALIQIKVEYTNISSYNWDSVKIKTILPPELKNTQIVMEYMAYPRPLVPDDNIGQFTSGFRFNEPENEVLGRMGNMLNSIQPPRRAYYLVLLKMDPNVEKGVYRIAFEVEGKIKSYAKEFKGNLSFDIPDAMISVINRDKDNGITGFNKVVLGTAELSTLTVKNEKAAQFFGDAKYSEKSVTPADFDKISDVLSVQRYEDESVINIGNRVFPTLDVEAVTIMEKVQTISVDGGAASEALTKKQILNFVTNEGISDVVTSDALKVRAEGPKIVLSQQILSLNGEAFTSGDTLQGVFSVNEEDSLSILLLEVMAENKGAFSRGARVVLQNENSNFTPFMDSLGTCKQCSMINGNIHLNFGSMVPGDVKKAQIYYLINTEASMQGGVNPLAKTMKSAEEDKENAFNVVSRNHVSFNDTEKEYSYTLNTPLIAKYHDISVTDVICLSDKIERGKSFMVQANIQNVGLPVDDVMFGLYLVANRYDESSMVQDTILISNPQRISLDNGEQYLMTFSAVIEDSSIVPVGNEVVELLVKADVENTYGELRKNNNMLAKSQSFGEHEYKEAVVVYPVPAVDFVNFFYVQNRTAGVKSMKLTVMDASGKKIYEKTVEGGRLLRWDVRSDVTQGVYFYKIEVDVEGLPKEEQKGRVLIIGNN